MENQHRKIRGYRELSQVEIDLMNKIKALGPEIEAVLNEVANHLNSQCELADTDEDERDRLNDAAPYRWVALASEHMQQGLMCLTRAVAQPTFF